jgi:hypothetical protein
VIVRVGVLVVVTTGVIVRVGVLVAVTMDVAVLVAVTIDDGVAATVCDGVYVRTEMTAGLTDKFKVYMNHLPVASSLNVAGVA